MDNMKLLDAGPEGSVLFELFVDQRYANLNDVMHGGAAGVIFDMGTTTALGPLAKPGYWLYDNSVLDLLRSLHLPCKLPGRRHSNIEYRLSARRANRIHRPHTVLGHSSRKDNGHDS